MTVVLLDSLVKTDLQGCLDQMVSRDSLDLPDKLEPLEILDSLEPRVHVVHPDQLVPWVTWGQLGLQGQTVTVEALDLRALREPLGLLGNLDR